MVGGPTVFACRTLFGSFLFSFGSWFRVQHLGDLTRFLGTRIHIRNFREHLQFHKLVVAFHTS